MIPLHSEITLNDNRVGNVIEACVDTITVIISGGRDMGDEVVISRKEALELMAK